MIFKAYVFQWNNHVHFNLYVGEKEGALGLAGKLIMREKEFIDFCMRTKSLYIEPNAMRQYYCNRVSATIKDEPSSVKDDLKKIIKEVKLDTITELGSGELNAIVNIVIDNNYRKIPGILTLKSLMNDICMECDKKGNLCFPQTCSILSGRIHEILKGE